MSRFTLLSLLTAVALAASPAFSGQRPAPATFEAVNSTLLTSAPLSGDFVLGDRKAPVKIIEYASLSCPHCAAFHQDVFPMLKKNYIDTGKALYILRQYPLNEPALKGAELVDCVGEDSGDERYYTFVGALFSSQNKWAYDQNFLSSLETFAKVGGVSKDRFEKCTADPDRELKILKSRKEASEALKVDHTPYFFINNNRFDDNVTYENISAYIDKKLGAAKVETPKEAAKKKAGGKIAEDKGDEEKSKDEKSAGEKESPASEK